MLDMKSQNNIYVIPASAGMTRMWDSSGLEPFSVTDIEHDGLVGIEL
jgi:hypothetical protein